MSTFIDMFWYEDLIQGFILKNSLKWEIYSYISCYDQ